jgi:apolipoprotein D and lipocalin family protein
MNVLLARLTAALIASLCLIAAPALGGPVPLKPVDPQRYAGRWYEIARLPNKIESDCANATSDWARQPDGGFDVVQTCHVATPGASDKTWRGSGRIVDGEGSSRFRIGFLGGLIQRDYLVLDRADDYSWCLLGMPNPKYMWIMARRPNLTPAEKAALVAHARDLGFDVSRLVFDNAPSA